MIEFLPTILVQSQEDFMARVKAVRGLLHDRSVPMLSIDIIDGLFVDAPPTFPTASFVDALDESFPFEVDLMIQDPIAQVSLWAKAGAQRIHFHVEAVDDLTLAVQQARDDAGSAEIGIVLNPETSIEVVDAVNTAVDFVQLMGVYPGASGQSFIPDTIDRVTSLHMRHPDILIAVDGGVKPDTAAISISGCLIWSEVTRSIVSGINDWPDAPG
jgi:ribulose-phosphate 3-epimerase